VSEKRRRVWWVGFELLTIALAAGALAIGLGSVRISRAEVNQSTANVARQVTMIGIIVTPDKSTIDPRLSSIKTQLDKLKPKHGFKLLDAESKRIETGESVTCDLKNGYTSDAVLVRPLDDSGKAELRCELWLEDARLFSSLVKTPLNQLFFYERQLDDGSELLIGVGAR
jgi:hypothetical protein